MKMDHGHKDIMDIRTFFVSPEEFLKSVLDSKSISFVQHIYFLLDTVVAD